MKTFEKTSLIHCSVDDLYDFHLDVNNLKVITPTDTKVELLNKSFRPYEGAVLKLKTVKNLIPSMWKVKIEKIQKPNILVDVALESPFKNWTHYHVFTQRGSLCELRDVVEYELPFGKVGEVFDFFIQSELKKMFDFRHRVTMQALE